MRLLRSSVVLVAVLASLVPAAAADAASRCFGESKGYKRHEIDRSRQIRLYWRSEVGFPKDDGSVIACWRPTGHTFDLGGSGVSADIGNFAIRGRFVALNLSEYNRGSSDTTVGVTVVDVRERRIVHEWLYTQYSGLTDGSVPLRVHKRHLRPNGSLAVLVGPYSNPSDYAPVYEVRVADRNGSRVLDRSAEIDPGSLRVSAQTVSWLHGDYLRTAPFD